jgi:hypothetical protein
MRLPEELKADLSDAAKAAGRSLNAEIRVRLEWSLEQAPEIAGVSHDATLLSRVTALEEWVRSQDRSFGTVADDDKLSVSETLIANAKKETF